MSERYDPDAELIRRSSFGVDSVKLLRGRVPDEVVRKATDRVLGAGPPVQAPNPESVDVWDEFVAICAALGWSGRVVPNVAVLGQSVSAVVRVKLDVHEWRVANGWPPRSDPSWFRTWFEPSVHDRLPVAAVELVGLLVNETRVDMALRSCGTLLTLAPCAVVLPAQPEDRPWPFMELDYYGIGVVEMKEDGSAELRVPPEERSTEFGPSLFGRWLLEVLYEKVMHGRGAMETVSSRGVRG